MRLANIKKVDKKTLRLTKLWFYLLAFNLLLQFQFVEDGFNDIFDKVQNKNTIARADCLSVKPEIEAADSKLSFFATGSAVGFIHNQKDDKPGYCISHIPTKNYTAKFSKGHYSFTNKLLMAGRSSGLSPPLI